MFLFWQLQKPFWAEAHLDTQLPLQPTVNDLRAVFLAAMAELQADFAAATADINAREKVLREALNTIRHTLQNGIGKTVLTPSHALARFMTDFNTELADVLQDWLDRIEKYDRNTAFRKGFTDSVVVFVLGKVKAGKSSLGNYVAYGRSDPQQMPISEPRPRFFTAAMAQGLANQAEAAIEHGGYFRVGVRETTKSIQGFRVPGLTWVDSPGLHSVTLENGALASDYADVADLIIYPMHTANPGRTGDIAEIQGLLRAEKRFLVVITQCDRSEEDEAPDGTIVQNWIMKDKAARQGQIDYVRRAVAADINTTSYDILSVSVRYAERHENDPVALEESGMGDFFRLLTEMVRSEGIRQKREAPSRNLDHFVNLVLGSQSLNSSMSIARVIASLANLKRKLAAATIEFDRHASLAVAAVFRRIGPVVTEQISCHASDKNQMGFEQACTAALLQIIVEEARTEVLALLSSSEGAVVPAISLAEISDFVKFKIITIRIPKSNRKVLAAGGKAIGGSLGGWGGTELGMFLGTLVAPGPGTAIGGVFGGAFGLLLGGLSGGAAGNALGSEWEETMQSGDNRAEVEASAIKALQRAGQDAVEGFFATLKSAVINPVDQRAAMLIRELEKFSEILEKKVHSNGRPLSTSI